MTKHLVVSEIDADAARLVIELNVELGVETDPALRSLADAKWAQEEDEAAEAAEVEAEGLEPALLAEAIREAAAAMALSAAEDLAQELPAPSGDLEELQRAFRAQGFSGAQVLAVQAAAAAASWEPGTLAWALALGTTTPRYRPYMYTPNKRAMATIRAARKNSTLREALDALEARQSQEELPLETSRRAASDRAEP